MHFRHCFQGGSDVPFLARPRQLPRQDLNSAFPYLTTHQLSTHRRVAQSHRVGPGHESPRHRTLETLIEPRLRADIKRRLRGLRLCFYRLRLGRLTAFNTSAPASIIGGDEWLCRTVVNVEKALNLETETRHTVVDRL